MSEAELLDFRQRFLASSPAWQFPERMNCRVATLSIALRTAHHERGDFPPPSSSLLRLFLLHCTAALFPADTDGQMAPTSSASTA